MSTNHILPLPKAIFGLKIAQLVLAVVILGLSAYGVTFLAFDGDSLSLFTALATMIITIYYIATTIALPVAYNYWAILGLDIFAIFFWLISFSLLASEVAAYGWATSNSSYCYYGYCYKKRDLGLVKRATTDYYTYRNSMAAAAGLGGLEFILFIITLVFTSLALHRHRKAGGHCTPNHAVGTAGHVVHHEQKDVELQGQNANNNGQYAPATAAPVPAQQQAYYPPQQQQV